ncbi:MAG: hypothetical protein M1829_005375 [Trizodia sp. TS-e1964]|nr:MAG: hypothetical protein M1829_005375 [Trizodia sp. TS-e1964]
MEFELVARESKYINYNDRNLHKHKLGVGKTRPRGDTVTLPGPNFQMPEVIQDGLYEAPKSEWELDGYTKERLQVGLRYVAATLKRDITPRTQNFLEMHLSALKEALNPSPSPSLADKFQNLGRVQLYDEIWYSESFLRRKYSREEMQRLGRVRKLREMEIISNYGNYLGLELKNFRIKLWEGAAPKVLWTDVAEAIATSAEEEEGWREEPELLAQNLEKALRYSCNALGLDQSHMLWTIQRYAERNRLFHSTINELIANCEWNSLGDVIFKDLNELPCVFGVEKAKPYEACVRRLADEFFMVLNPKIRVSWLPNAYAAELTIKFYARQQKHADRVKAASTADEQAPNASLPNKPGEAYEPSVGVRSKHSEKRKAKKEEQRAKREAQTSSAAK